MEQILFKCTIPGRPYVKKNGAKVYGNKYVTTKQYRAWEKNAALFINSVASMYPAAQLPFSGKFRLKAVFYFENGSSEPDLSALYEGIQDLLQKLGIIENDKFIYSHDGSTKVIGTTQPRLEFFLFKIG